MKQLGALIVWLSGALAVISAAFYACGYLITLEYLNLLGLDVYLFSYEPTFYLQRGASFFAFLLSLSSQFILYAALIIIAIALVFILLAKTIWSTLINRDWGNTTVLRYKQWLRSIIYSLLVVAILFSLDYYEELSRPLDVSNLLYEEISCPPERQNLDLRCNLAHNRGTDAGGHFLIVLLTLAFTAVLLTVAWRVTSAMRFRMLLIFPFVVVTVIYILLVPRFYGATIVQNTFSSVAITDGDLSSTASTPRFFLMNKTTEAFLLWDAYEREVVWLPVAKVPVARVGRRHSLAAIIQLHANAERPPGEDAQ